MITIEEFKKNQSNKIRLIGLDLGSKRVGISICDENQTIATPYKTINNSVKIASLNLECSPCYDTEVIKNCKKNICMESLGADVIYGMIEDFNL